MSRSSATYLYCVVSCRGTLSVARAPSGLPGLSRPRALPVGDGLWLVAADAPLPEYGAGSIQENLQDLDWISGRAMAHEAMVEHFDRAGTVVPMKLFTLFSDDVRALEHIRGDRDRLDRILTRIAGCQEWGLLVRFDESRAKEAVAGDSRPASGTAFLQRKKQEKDASRTLLARLQPEMDEVFADLADQSVESRRRPPVSPSPLLLDGAFLVRNTDALDFEETVRGWAERLRESACELTLTGPWPPYNFLEEQP
ncbi:MAG: GvpL/GvpF family gas vesicle protein [Acidobacteriota bacterium]